MKEYQTGLKATGYVNRPLLELEVRGAGWSATLAKAVNRKWGGGGDIHIHASNWTTAQRALDLIIASLTLYHGQPPTTGMGWLLAHNDDEPSSVGWDADILEAKKQHTMGIMGIPVACAIAAKASRTARLAYSINRFAFSMELSSQYGVDLEPGAPHLGITAFPSVNLRRAYALLAAYTCIEDLDLQVKPALDGQSTENGKLKTAVRKDLEARLKKAGVDMRQPQLWTARGRPRRIDGRRGLAPIGKPPWSSGLIRDSYLDLCDAINHASWLRNKTAAHGVGELNMQLNSYDVDNVQHLARRLLLEHLGFWKCYE